MPAKSPNQPVSPFKQGGSQPALEGAARYLPRGAHVCQIYTTPNERMDAVLDFLQGALQTGERTFCISETLNDEFLGKFLDGFGLSLPATRASRQLQAGSNRDFYLDGGDFDLQRTLGKWDTLKREALEADSGCIWAIADVLPELRFLQGGTQLTLYEAKLDRWMHYNQATIVCQYDARMFDGCTIMDILRIHPLVLANRRVLQSPFFKPQDRLRSN